MSKFGQLFLLLHIPHFLLQFPTGSDAVAFQGSNRGRTQDQAFTMSSQLEQRRAFDKNSRCGTDFLPQTLPSMDWFATTSELVGAGSPQMSNTNRPITTPFAYSDQLSVNSSRTSNDAMTSMNSAEIMTDIRPASHENNPMLRQSIGDRNKFNQTDHNICKVCSRIFPTLTELRGHEASHHRKGAFPCSVCGKSFTHPSNRYRHMLSHKGIQKHQCSVCFKKFSRRDHLHCHMASHYKISDDGSTLLENTGT
jgi:hypothetical protein